ncbi:MAG: archaellin/type IV pilin N-terminal domain-containing protein [Nitrososphaerales archaeon]
MKSERRGISPIIATLLLILIAIAAGVVVYAYVVGFIGNSTTNTGGATNTLSMDQLNIASSNSKAPVTAFVRNLGPASETFNTGFYVKGTSINNQLGVAISIASASTDSITAVTLGSSSSGISVTLVAASCTSGHTATVNVLGTQLTVTCGSGSFWGKAALTSFSMTNSTAGYFGTIAASTSLSITSQIIGVPASTGAAISLPINSVGQFTLAAAGLQTSNPLSSGQTYSASIIGADGATTTASAKAA